MAASPAYSMAKRLTANDKFVLRAEELAAQSPGPGAHDLEKYNGFTEQLTCNKTTNIYAPQGRVQHTGVTTAVHTFSKAPTGRQPGIGPSKVLPERGFQKDNYGLHSPGPAKYGVKDTIGAVATGQLGVLAKAPRRTVAYSFDRSPRF